MTLATPTAVAAAISAATRRGVAIREGDVLERLADASIFCWDKTGTLTVGKPEVTAIKTFGNDGVDEEKLLALAAAVEQFSEHPLAKAIVRRFRELSTAPLVKVEKFCAKPGRGAFGVVAGDETFVGSERALVERNVAIPETARLLCEPFISEGSAAVYVAVGGVATGAIFLSDRERPTSAATIERLRALGARSRILTGDGPRAAETIARRLNVDDVKANCLPENKLKEVETLREAGERVCMIGDGVNDAPALAKANVSVALGGGSDFAASVADITLLTSDIKDVAATFALAKKMTTVIRFNLVFALVLNFLAVALAAGGWLGPIGGALAHNAGSIFVVANSVFLTSWREKF